MTIYREASRQRQGRQAAQPEAAVILPEGEHKLIMSSSGLWRFEAEGTVYTVKQRQAEGTKPRLYIMAELKPQPAYVSSLYFCSADSGYYEEGQERLRGWHYTAQAPSADSPLLYVSLWELRLDKENTAETLPIKVQQQHSITVAPTKMHPKTYRFSSGSVRFDSLAFIAR